MIYSAHQFTSPAALAAARAMDEPAALDVIGTAYGPPVLDAEGEVAAPGEALPGWFAIAAWDGGVPAAWEASRMAPAEAPRWWAGVARDAPAPPAPPVPLSISPLQARRALLAAGLLDDVEAALAEAPRETQLAWEYAVEVRRDDPMLITVAAALGLSAEQVDALFLAAVA
jgi:hypothetical protein